jgi:undecaprenyl diphosphate synthase
VDNWRKKLGMQLNHREELLKGNPNLPRHIGIIMDGNGRWAKKRRLPRISGHNAGIDSVRRVVNACGELGIQVLTLYTFSHENWKRPRFEVSALMKLLLNTLNKEIDELIEKDVKIKCIGNIERLPEDTRDSLREASQLTENNSGLILNLALSYGSRQEIADAIKKIANRVRDGLLDPEDINDDVIRDHLQTADLPDPDLVIRTSGEFRISNFLLWQIAYSEIFVTKTLWPDFQKKDLFEAIEDYLKRERRFGMVTEQLHQT